MTDRAYHEAIDAVLATGLPVHKGVIAGVIRAIPDDVLVRLAIERGALERAGSDEWSELYRVVES